MKRITKHCMEEICRKRYPKLKYHEAIAKMVSGNEVIRMRNKKRFSVMDKVAEQYLD